MIEQDHVILEIWSAWNFIHCFYNKKNNHSRYLGRPGIAHCLLIQNILHYQVNHKLNDWLAHSTITTSEFQMRTPYARCEAGPTLHYLSSWNESWDFNASFKRNCDLGLPRGDR